MVTKKGLVLSGAGGAIGFLGGALEALNDNYNEITGVSSGGIVASMKATGQIKVMKNILFNIEDSDVVKKRTFRYAKRFLIHLAGLRDPLTGLYDNKPLRRLLTEYLVNKEVQTSFTVIAFCLDDRDLEYFTFPAGMRFHKDNIDLVVSKIIATTAIPGVFSPEKINGKLYVDGGVKTHTPIEPLKVLLPDADHITIISTAGAEKSSSLDFKTDLGILGAIAPELISAVAEIDFLKFEYRNELALCGNDKYKYYPATIIKPKQSLSPTVRFHKDYMIEDWHHGRVQAFYDDNG